MARADESIEGHRGASWLPQFCAQEGPSMRGLYSDEKHRLQRLRRPRAVRGGARARAAVKMPADRLSNLGGTAHGAREGAL